MSTHIGDAWRAAGLLPIAMVVQCTGSIAPGPGRISDFRHRLLGLCAADPCDPAPLRDRPEPDNDTAAVVQKTIRNSMTPAVTADICLDALLYASLAPSKSKCRALRNVCITAHKPDSTHIPITAENNSPSGEYRNVRKRVARQLAARMPTYQLVNRRELGPNIVITPDTDSHVPCRMLRLRLPSQGRLSTLLLCMRDAPLLPLPAATAET